MITAFIFTVAFLLAAIGIAGVVLRRNPIIILMSIELILNSGNLILVAVDRIGGTLDGQLFALMVIGVAAAEVAVGLALVVRVFHDEPVADVDDYRSMSG
jgi:NADH:ubiquinone oxidoreductase subunit K